MSEYIDGETSIKLAKIARDGKLNARRPVVDHQNDKETLRYPYPTRVELVNTRGSKRYA